MPTANELLAEQIIDHAVDLSHYSNGVASRMSALMARLEPELFARLIAAISRLGNGAFTVRRLDALLRDVLEFNRMSYGKLSQAMDLELRSFTEIEAQFQFESFYRAVPKPVLPLLRAISVDQVYAAAVARPFQGRLLNGWISNMAKDRAKRIRDTVRAGFVENKAIAEIARELRGTKAMGYQDGIINADRRSVDTVVRTAIGHLAAFTRERFHQRNADIIGSKVWVSTLDTRTTEACQIRDGLEYDLDNTPIGHRVPWLSGPGQLHWNCRSTSMPVLKRWQEIGVDMSSGSRASMDGQIPASTTYREWLAKQSATRQDEILGPTRGALLRNGSLTINSFWNDRGRFLTLEELRSRNPGIGAKP